MTYILNIYLKDKRTPSGRRIVSSQEYTSEQEMLEKIKQLEHTHTTDNGYTIETIKLET